MTYFHRRTPTIIGAKAFHCPVRNGKGVVPPCYGRQAVTGQSGVMDTTDSIWEKARADQYGSAAVVYSNLDCVIKF